MTQRSWSHPEFAAIAEYIGQRVGLRFPENQRARAEAEIRRAMVARSVADPERYHALAVHDDAALADLVGRLTVGESYFFRDPAQFELIRQELLPSLLRRRGGVPIRAWSAGCASGEEAYSLAILLRQERCEGRIVGTDISHARLEKARRGRYSDWSLRAVPPAAAQHYFIRNGRYWELEVAIRDAVAFRYLNLAEECDSVSARRMTEMDLVLCRNVLIYLTEEAVARTAQRLLDSLSADGWLLLGASDPSIADLVSCEVVVTDAGVAYRRGRGRAATASAPPAPPLGWVESPTKSPTAPPPPPAAAERAAERKVRMVQDECDPAPSVARVRSLANQGLLEDAGKVCAAAVDQDRTSAELAYLHTVLLVAAGRHQEAAAAARRTLYLDRRMIVAHVALATACSRAGDLVGAHRALRNAERLLDSMPPAELVPASDGEPAGRLLAAIRLKLRMLAKAAA